MFLTLEELAEIFRSVAREHRIDADVVGVIAGEGGGAYAEVFVDLRGERRISVGLARDRMIADLRRDIARRLVAEI